MKANLTPIYIFPCGMGDAVMALAVARNYYEQTGKVMHIGHNCTAIFENCDYIVCHPEYAFWSLNEQSQKNAELEGFHLISLFYFCYRQACSDFWIYYSPHKNLISHLCSQVGLSGDLALQPELRLSADEKKVGAFAQGKIAIISSGVAEFKTWPVEKMQKVVDSFPEHKFVQIGMPTDPLLNNVEDCRGKYSLRQVAGILYNVRLFFGPVGGMMHLARSVNCPAVILMPSFETESWYYSGYHYITSSPRCTKCDAFQRNPSHCIGKHTCINITEEQAVSALRDILDYDKEILQPEFAHVEPNPVSGLDFYYKTISYFPYGLKLICSLPNGEILDSVEFTPDDGILDIPFSLIPDNNKYVEIEFKQNLKWLFSVNEIYWESSYDGTKITLFAEKQHFLQLKTGGQYYLSSYHRSGKLIVKLPDSIKENGILHLDLRYLAMEHCGVLNASLFSNAWRFRYKAKIFYNVIRLIQAFKDDSLLHVVQRCKNALFRFMKKK